jgi:hypothetical protein
MPSEGREEPDATAERPQAPTIAHADGTLTLEGGSVRVAVTKGRDYRGTIDVPLERCTLRVMGRAIAVFDGGRLVHLCSRCKPTAEVASLVAAVGDRATLEPRTPFATLLALREESAAYRPAGAAARDQNEAPRAAVDAADPAPEIPPGHESLRRVYLSQAAMERDSRRLRAAGWVAHQVSMSEDLPADGEATRPPGRLRGLVRAANPRREATEGVIIWVRPHPGETPSNPPEG